MRGKTKLESKIKSLGEIIMKLERIKLTAIVLFAVSAAALGFFKFNPAGTAVLAKQEDMAAVYKTKCAMCHKATAEKFFDPAKMDDVLVEVVLKGKKAEKPPNMPGFEEKGMTKDQAKLLVAYMRQMRTPAPDSSPAPAPKPK